MCVTDFSPGLTNHFIEKKSVAITITVIADMIRKSHLLCGPVPCVIPRKYLGCAISQVGQAKANNPVVNIATISSIFFIIMNLMLCICLLLLFRSLQFYKIHDLLYFFFCYFFCIVAPGAAFVIHNGRYFCRT